MNQALKKWIYMTYTLTMITMLLLLIIPLQAQDDQIEEFKKFITKKRINAAYIMFGFNHVGTDNMNTFLHSSGLPTVEEDYLSLGFGGHVIHNRFVLGFEVVKMFEKEGQTVKEFSTAMGAKYTLLNFGFLAHQKKGLMFYPTIGIGLGEMKLRVTENNIHSFEDFTGSQRGSESRRLGILFQLSAALDYFHKYKDKKKGRNSIVFGIRAGYIFTPMRFKWKVNYVTVGDGPNSALNGFYIRLVFGLGGYIENLIRVVVK